LISYGNVGDISLQWGMNYHEARISDIHTVHWEMYYIHVQSGRTPLLFTLCQASGGCGTLQQ